MRQESIIGTTMWVEYPDYLIFTQDNNTIKIGSSTDSDTVGARIVMREPTGNQVVLDYWSETNEILFLLNDSIDQLYRDNLSEWSVLVECYSNSNPQATFTFQMKVYDGKSFPDRSHSATKTIYWNSASDLAKVQIFTYEGGTATVHNTSFPLVAGITSLNLSNLHLSNNETIHISSTANLSTTPQYLGDMWGNSTVPVTSYDIQLVYMDSVCGNNGGPVKITYKDCDGCYRIAVGTISKETTNAKYDTYTRITSIYRNGANQYNVSNSKVLTVGFNDIDRFAYLSDMMYSEKVQMLNYNNEYVEVGINTTKLQLSDFQNDFEIEFLINNQN